MLEFMRAGGFGMWIILLFGLITVGTAGLFAWHPNERRYVFFEAMTKATLYASLTGLCAGFAAVMYHIPASPEWANSPKIHLIIMEGLGEAFSNPILGFAFLGVGWLITAFGERRRTSVAS